MQMSSQTRALTSPAPALAGASPMTSGDPWPQVTHAIVLAQGTDFKTEA